MKKIFIIIQFFLFNNAFCQDWQISTPLYAPTVNNPEYKPGWHLIFNDKFNTGTLNTNFWHIWGPGYVDTCNPADNGGWVDPNNYELTNETIKLKCKKINDYRKDPGCASSFFYDYSGMWIDSKKEYGAGYYYEARCKRNALGSKSSFWFSNYTSGHDIDVFDNDFTYPTDMDYFHVDFGEHDSLTRRSFDVYFDNNMPEQDQEYYTYAVDWQKNNKINLYSNNHLVAIHSSFKIDPGKISFWCVPIYWKPEELRREGALEIDYFRIYEKNCDIQNSINNYGIDQGFSNQNERPRLLADVNGDGRNDIVAFAWKYTLVSLAKSDGTFGVPQYVFQDLTKEQGFTNQNERPRFVADINGDGKADIIAFGYKHVVAYLSTSTDNVASFTPKQWSITNDLTVEQGFTNQNARPRFVADINGDKKADIIAFGYKHVVAYLSTTTDNITSFTPKQWSIANDLTVEQGFTNQNERPRLIADINGDKKADIVAFGYKHVVAYLSTSIGNVASFSPKQWPLNNEFTKEQGYANQEERSRALADVNGDSKADIVAFAWNYTLVSLSTSNGANASFKSPDYVLQNFTKEQGWTTMNDYPRILADVNGDKKVDIIGFGDGETKISISKSNSTTASFYEYQNVIDDFTKSKGWINQNTYPRFVEDINGDGNKDILGFGKNKVYALTCLSPQKNRNYSLKNENIDSINTIKNIDENILIYPNPSSGILNIKTYTNEAKLIEISDICGKIVYSLSTSDDLVALKVHTLTKGIYFLKIKSSSNIQSRKFILE